MWLFGLGCLAKGDARYWVKTLFFLVWVQSPAPPRPAPIGGGAMNTLLLILIVWAACRPPGGENAVR